VPFTLAGLGDVMATSSPNPINLDPPSCLLPLNGALLESPKALHPLVKGNRLCVEVRGWEGDQRQGVAYLLKAPLLLPLKLGCDEGPSDTLDRG